MPGDIACIHTGCWKADVNVAVVEIPAGNIAIPAALQKQKKKKWGKNYQKESLTMNTMSISNSTKASLHSWIQRCIVLPLDREAAKCAGFVVH